MKVIATQPGFHGGRRRTGDIFDVPDKSKASWFEPADKAKPKGKAKEDKMPETLSAMARVEHEAQGDALV